MNKKLRGRAEVMIFMGADSPPTDRQTLDAAIRIAHHEKSFQEIGNKWQPYFEDMARRFRIFFPQCPCKRCQKVDQPASPH